MQCVFVLISVFKKNFVSGYDTNQGILGLGMYRVQGVKFHNAMCICDNTCIKKNFVSGHDTIQGGLGLCKFACIVYRG